MIDTGAGSTVLHIEAAKEKGCKVGPLDQVIFGIGGAPAALTEVPEIRLGQAFIKDQVLLSADMFKDIPNARKEYDAILGAEFMSKMRAVISYKKEEYFFDDLIDNDDEIEVPDVLNTDSLKRRIEKLLKNRQKECDFN